MADLALQYERRMAALATAYDAEKQAIVDKLEEQRKAAALKYEDAKKDLDTWYADRLTDIEREYGKQRAEIVNQLGLSNLKAAEEFGKLPAAFQPILGPTESAGGHEGAAWAAAFLAAVNSLFAALEAHSPSGGADGPGREHHVRAARGLTKKPVADILATGWRPMPSRPTSTPPCGGHGAGLVPPCRSRSSSRRWAAWRAAARQTTA